MKKILFEYRDFNDQYVIESAWASKVGENYRLENILWIINGAMKKLV